MPHPGQTPQVYDFIDRHITKLDKDCKAFDAGGCTAYGWVKCMEQSWHGPKARVDVVHLSGDAAAQWAVWQHSVSRPVLPHRPCRHSKGAAAAGPAAGGAHGGRRQRGHQRRGRQAQGAQGGRGAAQAHARGAVPGEWAAAIEQASAPSSGGCRLVKPSVLYCSKAGAS